MVKHRLLSVILASILGGLGLYPSASFAQSNRTCFDVPTITDCVEGRFLEYWQQSGGLPVFGYPISPAINETTPEGLFLTQYFERARFELHPTNARPYDVLLGRLGDVRLQQQGRDWRTLPRAEPTAAHYFAETGHAVAHEPFWAYWSTHGLEFDGQSGFSAAESLALFGLPLSEPTVETNANGDTILTQWFERARFEDHGVRGVLLGFLGKETYNPNTPPTPTPNPGDLTKTFAPAEDTFVHSQFPDQNFGKDGLLVADGDPVREAYLKFDVSGLQGRRVAKAELRIYVTTLFEYTGGAISGGTVRRISNNTWSETAVTYNTRPTIDGAPLSTLGQVVQGNWYTFDVTGGVATDGILSLAITTADYDGVYYNSRETAETAPQLVITLAP